MPYPSQPARREREYPPTPYAPRSAETAAYRSSYDLGQRHFGTFSWDIVSRHEAGLRPGSPAQRGYRDGVVAAWRRLQKLEAFGREVARRDSAESRAQLRKESQDDRPY